MSEWISVEDKLPEHGQHVLVWEDRFNVLFPRGHRGDDGEGRVRMGDAIYLSGEHKWREMLNSGEAKKWGNSKDKYIECGNGWDKWSGQGPCSFGPVTHWMPLPEPPKEFNDETEN